MSKLGKVGCVNKSSRVDKKCKKGGFLKVPVIVSQNNQTWTTIKKNVRQIRSQNQEQIVGPVGWVSFQCRRKVLALLVAHIGVGKEQPPSKIAAKKIFFRKQGNMKDAAAAAK